MKKTLVYTVTSLAALFLLAGGTVRAEDANPPKSSPPSSVVKYVTITRVGKINMEGTISSIQDNIISVASWGGTWSVDTSGAKLVRKFGAASNLNEFRAGDIVIVNGTVSDNWTVLAKTVKNESIQAKNAQSSGDISNVSADNKTFNLATKNKGNVQVVVSDATKITVNGKTGGLSDITEGMRGIVLGVWDRTGAIIMASKVMAVKKK